MHPRNRHTGRYHFPSLIQEFPELGSFVAPNQYGDESIDFANPQAVKALNRALLKKYYGIAVWDIPQDYLCPPIPGRADYIHNIADLLARDRGGEIPRGSKIRGLDIGVGANCIYPIIGHCEYGWSYVGADVNPVSVKNANWIVESNPELSGIELRLQKNPQQIFKGIVEGKDFFHFSSCNPPFHGSLEEAQAGTRRKWTNLGKPKHEKQTVNFGGQGAELWCPGGEMEFTRTMISESAGYQAKCVWFSTLVSREDSLPRIEAELKIAKATEWVVLDMAQGQKKSRIMAWTYMKKDARAKALEIKNP